MHDIKKALAGDGILVGPFSVTASPPLIEAIGYAGFDFVRIGCEHAAISRFGTSPSRRFAPRTLQTSLRSCR